jgi:hypothetical protein
MISLSDERVREEINENLFQELEESLILTPETGVMRIKKILQRYGLDIPALYGLDVDGDENVVPIEQFMTDIQDETYNLYLIYYLTDDGTYDFYAEITDENGIEEILNIDGDEEEESE